MSLTTNLGISLAAIQRNVLDFATAEFPLSKGWQLALASGVVIDAADVLYSDQLTITTGATVDLDLAAGGLLDAFGAAFAPVKVKMVLLVAAAANTTIVTAFGDANSVPILSAAATTVALKPGGIFLFADPSLAGVAVTAATGDIIQLANAAGASAVVDVVIIGTSA